jgi:hypothetical protein
MAESSGAPGAAFFIHDDICRRTNHTGQLPPSLTRSPPLKEAHLLRREPLYFRIPSFSRSVRHESSFERAFVSAGSAHLRRERGSPGWVNCNAEGPDAGRTDLSKEVGSALGRDGEQTRVDDFGPVGGGERAERGAVHAVRE